MATEEITKNGIEIPMKKTPKAQLRLSHKYGSPYADPLQGVEGLLTTGGEIEKAYIEAVARGADVFKKLSTTPPPESATTTLMGLAQSGHRRGISNFFPLWTWLIELDGFRLRGCEVSWDVSRGQVNIRKSNGNEEVRVIFLPNFVVVFSVSGERLTKMLLKTEDPMEVSRFLREKFYE